MLCEIGINQRMLFDMQILYNNNNKYHSFFLLLLLLNIPAWQCRKEQGSIRSADPHTAMPDRKGSKMVSQTENG